ncbi:hypothetical protein [Roseibium sediminicola]|uniref:Uncharacterized protein n=1 Tax=Roseibium sediminicola TaxID=2933272 RepID=A0ABT0GXU3_9HYPH|nr:hypothetical protein [Roseibium sp. CAU 1639]MCK7614141.1 hypothetical protein [Roseibium sp. CAU 1639]
MAESMAKIPIRQWIRGAALTAVCLVLTASLAHAQAGRPDTRRLTCNEAQQLVQKSGSIVMTTGPSTFEKFVANASYCLPQSNQVRANFAPTKDNPECAVGNRCYQNRGSR